jgi:hypothetical protein
MNANAMKADTVKIELAGIKQTSKYFVRDYGIVIKRAKTGLGLFATQDIPKGACILEYVGKVINDEDATKSKSKYLFEVSKNHNIDGSARSNKARYLNHACIPNCVVEKHKKRIFVFTDKKVKDGDELTFDYGIEYFDEFIKPHGCKCATCVKK